MGTQTVKLKSSGRTVKLGRIRPVGFRESDSFREVIYADGRVKTFAKLGPHWSARYRTASVPSAVDWYTKAAAIIDDMLGNDTDGDCVIASALHQVGVWTANEGGVPAQSSTQEALAQYHSICGPGDNGCVITDVLDYTKSRGLKLSGVVHKIDDYVAVDWTNRPLVEAALQTFGSIKLGINLPDAWTDTNVVWDVTNTRIVGGHDVPAFGCGNKRPSQVVGTATDGVVISTWAGLVLITWPAFLSKNWIEEAYVPLSPDWYSKGNVAPNGFNVDTLRADLAMIGQGEVPPIGPPPPPLPPPPPPPPPPTPAPHVLFPFDLTRDKRRGDSLKINHVPVDMARAKGRYFVGTFSTGEEEVPQAE